MEKKDVPADKDMVFQDKDGGCLLTHNKQKGVTQLAVNVYSNSLRQTEPCTGAKSACQSYRVSLLEVTW